MGFFPIVALIILVVTPLAIWIFGMPLGIMIGAVSPIFIIPAFFILSLLWAGRRGRNPWQ